MARARNIKPSFFQNEELGELSPITRLAFIGMWTIADYKGCIEFRPKRLKVQLMPYDDCDFEQIANDLDKSGLIAIYTVAGQRYIKIVKFEQHQNPHKNERESGSDIPDFDQASSIGAGSSGIQNNPDKNGTAPADSPFLKPSSLNPDSGLQGSSAQTPAPAAPKRTRKSATTPLPDGFCISEQVQAWAAKNRVQNLDRHFASFIDKVKAKGYVYADWDAALRNAISDDWAKLGQQQQAHGSSASGSQLGKAGQQTAAAAQQWLEQSNA